MNLPMVVLTVSLAVGTFQDTIVPHPQGLTGPVGLTSPNTVELTAVVVSDTPVTITWYKGTAKAGSGPVLRLTTTASGSYRAEVTNAAGTVSSRTIRIATTTSTTAANLTVTTKR